MNYLCVMVSSKNRTHYFKKVTLFNFHNTELVLYCRAFFVNFI